MGNRGIGIGVLKTGVRDRELGTGSGDKGARNRGLGTEARDFEDAEKRGRV